VYYKMEAIEYVSAMDIKDYLFDIEALTAKRQVSPRVNELAPQQFDTQGNQEEGYSLRLRSPSAAADSIGQQLDLPLYPTNLPEGYHLDAITLLDCSPLAAYTGEEAVVYQLEIYGPRGDLLSVFQTHLDDSGMEPGSVIAEESEKFVLQQVNGWLTIAFGSLPVSELEMVLDGLSDRDEQVRLLLEETKARDLVIQQVIEAGRD
jgi:hypothetical protein